LLRRRGKGQRRDEGKDQRKAWNDLAKRHATYPPSAPRIDAFASDTIPLTAKAGTQEMLIADLPVASL
jgi:hypothetical protein